MKKLAIVGLTIFLAVALAGCQFQLIPTPPPAAPTANIILPTRIEPKPTITPIPALNSPSGPPLRVLDMLTISDGWGLINNALLLTHDGGKTWYSVPMPEGQVDDQTEAFFVDKDTLYLVVPAPDGKSGQLYFSKNGGGLWKITPVPFIRGQLLFIEKTGYFRVSTRTGADSMKTTIFSSEDNGLTWKVISPGANQDPGNELPEAGNKTGFSFINSQRGWLGVADQPKALVLYRTDNGGRNWNLQTIPAPQNMSSLVTTTLPPVFFKGNTNDGLLPVIFSAQPGADGSLVFYITSDGGVGWLPAGSLEGGKVFSFIDPLTGWAWAKRALYFTTDGTKTWQVLPVAFGASEQAISIKFINKNNGWILTRDLKNRVRIYSTNDGGNTWVAFAP